MTYLGSPPASQAFAPGTDTFNGDGTTVAFALSRNVATVNDILVIVNNVEQQPSNYTVSGSTLTFSPAPSAGTNNIYVRYLSTNLQTIAPQQGSVYPASLSTPNALYWDTSGNVGVGTTTPGTRVDAYASGTTSTILRTRNDTVAVYLDANSSYSYLNTFTNHPMLFGTNNTERMRIDSSGNVGIGIISTNGFWGSTNTDAKVNIAYSSSGTTFDTAIKGLVLQNTNTTTSNTTSLIFGTQNTGGTGIAQAAIYSINGTRGGAFNSGQLGFSYANSSGVLTEAMRIDSSGGLILAGSTAQKATGTTWSNPSDQRLKNNIRDYAKGTAELMQVRVREWEYNGKGGTTEGVKGLGVVADEVMEVLPNTVDNYEAKLNADDEETTAIKKFDATEITWLLVKTVQEQQAMIEELKTKVAALEAR